MERGAGGEGGEQNKGQIQGTKRKRQVKAQEGKKMSLEKLKKEKRTGPDSLSVWNASITGASQPPLLSQLQG